MATQKRVRKAHQGSELAGYLISLFIKQHSDRRTKNIVICVPDKGQGKEK